MYRESGNYEEFVHRGITIPEIPPPPLFDTRYCTHPEILISGYARPTAPSSPAPRDYLLMPALLITDGHNSEN